MRAWFSFLLHEILHLTAYLIQLRRELRPVFVDIQYSDIDVGGSVIQTIGDVDGEVIIGARLPVQLPSQHDISVFRADTVKREETRYDFHTTHLRLAWAAVSLIN